jgi:ABC-type multidrug transport system ATPase subunit
MMPIIEVSNLSFSFDEKPVLDSISMAIAPGTVYGFLGINGAGKTTTLRLLLGLLKTRHSDIRLLGRDLATHRLEILQRVGSLIEQPSLYGHLSGKENLEVVRLSYDAPKSRIDQVLRIVGLSEAGGRKAKTYSLGMKQRLAIGIALMNAPDILILDEPTNGLDPSGIIEIRQLIKRLNQEEGLTIIVSSHLLAEVEKMATHVGIIHKGRIMFEGDLHQLQHIRNGRMSVTAEVDDVDRGIELLSPEYAVAREGNLIRLHLRDKQAIAQANALLVNNGVDVYGLSAGKGDLEELFISIINS